MSERVSIQRKTVQETLILPLYGRYVANKNYPQVFKDTMAFEIMKKIRYDFHSIGMGSLSSMIYGLRHEQLVTSAKNYLKKYPDAIIVNLGCGLDTSFSFIDNGRCHYVNLDLPEVIELREKLFTLRPREMNLACDALDYIWMDRIGADPDSHVYILGGGFFHFLAPDKVKALIARMAERFTRGGMVFDYGNRKSMESINRSQEKTGQSTRMLFAMQNAAKELPSYSTAIESVNIVRKLPESCSGLPLATRIILSHELHSGNLGFAEVSFR